MKITELENKISALPVGYISKKIIGGKVRYYRQWTENGKIKSKYIKAGELELVQEQIAKRKELQSKLKNCLCDNTAVYSAKTPGRNWKTSVVVGASLKTMVQEARLLQKRDCFEVMDRFLQSGVSDRVCLVYGLRRTGKTTMMRQAIAGFSASNFSRTAYIKASARNDIGELNEDLNTLYADGYRYIFIDEVTLLQDFIESASLFSDVFAPQGMKIVLSGTDSLGFWFAMHGELYDRAVMVHTTYIPFAEHSRLLGISNIDEYIRYGGTLRAGELDFDSPELQSEEASFRDDESTRRYIDSAICQNIQHSLKCCEDGGHFRHLRDLFLAGELTGAINRIIEDMNHNFLVDVLTTKFVSHDLHLAGRNVNAVTAKLMKILKIRNREEQTVKITEEHVKEIREYLKALDLIENCAREGDTERIVFTQPGMRFCQAQALVYALFKSRELDSVSEREKKLVRDRILDEVRGRMLEDIVLFETRKSLSPTCEAFKLQFAEGEYDMVVYDSEADECECYEIKHSSEIVENQYRHLVDGEKLKETKRRFGNIRRRAVLYRGDDCILDNGVEYKNVEVFLKELK